MSSKLEPAIWSRDIGHIHIGIHWRTVTETTISRTDGLPYFLTSGAPRKGLRRGAQSTAITRLTGNILGLL